MWLQCHAMGMACKYTHSPHGRNRTKARPKSRIRPRLSTTPSASVGVRAFVHGMYVVHPMSLGCVCHTEVSSYFYLVAHARGRYVRTRPTRGQPYPARARTVVFCVLVGGKTGQGLRSQEVGGYPRRLLLCSPWSILLSQPQSVTKGETYMTCGTPLAAAGRLTDT